MHFSYWKPLASFKKTEEGRWEASDPILDTGAAGYHKLKINHYHSEVLKSLARMVELVHPDERECGMLTLPIRREQLPELRKRVQNFQDEIIGWLQSEENPDTLCNLGTYLISLNKEEPK